MRLYPGLFASVNFVSRFRAFPNNFQIIQYYRIFIGSILAANIWKFLNPAKKFFVKISANGKWIPEYLSKFNPEDTEPQNTGAKYFENSNRDKFRVLLVQRISQLLSFWTFLCLFSLAKCFWKIGSFLVLVFCNFFEEFRFFEKLILGSNFLKSIDTFKYWYLHFKWLKIRQNPQNLNSR